MSQAQTVNPLKPATKEPSQRARLVIEMGEHKGSATNECWCGCFISTIKKLKRDGLCVNFEDIADAALASGEYTAVHLSKVSYFGNNHTLTGQRTEGNETTYYELAGFESLALERDLYKLTFERPDKNFKPKFSRQSAETLVFILFFIFISTYSAGSPQSLWLFVMLPVCVVAAYFTARTTDKQRHVVRVQSLALDTMPAA